MKFKDIIEKFAPKPEPTTKRTQQLTNTIILKELKDHFTERLEEESVGRRMIYPMSFTILMHPEDYKDREPAFPFIIEEIIESFYKVMQEKRSKYPQVLPSMAKDWSFQFTSCEMVMTADTEELQPMEKGQLTTIANLTQLKLGKEQNETNVTQDINTRSSMRTTNSAVGGNTTINFEVLRNIDILAEGYLRRPFDARRFEENTTKEEPRQPKYGRFTPDGKPLFGEISYNQSNENYHYAITDNLITITNENDCRKGSSYLKLKDENIKETHAQIKYIPENKTFQIAVFAKARLNQRLLTISSVNNMQWFNLPDNSKIFLNESVSLEFKIG